MADRLRVGILGAGWAGGGHAAAFSRLPDVEVGAVWSRTWVADKVYGRDRPSHLSGGGGE